MRLARNAALSLIVGIGVALGPMAPAQAAPPAYVYSANAFGTYAFVGNLVLAGKTAPSSIDAGGCGGVLGDHVDNAVASVSAAPLATAGAITSSADAKAIVGGTEATSSAQTAGLSLLDGLITADAVKAVATASQDALGFHTSSAGSTLVNLVIDGTPIAANPAPNTTINLAGLGKVTLNEQGSTITPTFAKFSVTAIHVQITVADNDLDLGVGTHVFVSRASAVIRSTAGNPGRLGGGAYATRLKVGNNPGVLSGVTVPVGLPCVGTDGATTKATQVGLNLPGVATSGTATSTAYGQLAPLVSGETTDTIQNLNILSGLITATLVKADAHGSAVGTTFSFNDAGSQFVSLAVSGHPEITAAVPANTQISLLGLGTLWLHRVIQTPDRIEVRMIELKIGESNSYGLSIGTDLRVGVAYVSLHT